MVISLRRAAAVNFENISKLENRETTQLVRRF